MRNIVFLNATFATSKVIISFTVSSMRSSICEWYCLWKRKTWWVWIVTRFLRAVWWFSPGIICANPIPLSPNTSYKGRLGN